MEILYTYKCLNCGASKRLEGFDWIIRCDHCGTLICADYEGFQRSELYQRLATSVGASLTAVQGDLDELQRKMDEGVKAGDQEEWSKLATQKEWLTLASYPDSFFETHQPGLAAADARRGMVTSQVDFWRAVHFVPEVRDAYQAANQADQVLQEHFLAEDGKAAERAATAVEAWRAYYEAVYQHHDPRKFGLTFDEDESVRTAVSSYLQGLLHPNNPCLHPNAKAEIARRFRDLDPTLAKRSEELAPQVLVPAICPRCGQKEARRGKAVGILFCEH